MDGESVAYDGYRFPWKTLAVSSLYDRDAGTQIDCSFSRAFIWDSDLIRKSERRPNPSIEESESMTEQMSGLKLDGTSALPESPVKPAMSKTVWKGLPRGFGKRAKTGKYMKEGTYKDTVEFEQFFQDFQTRFIYGSWLEDFGEDMKEEDRNELRKEVELSPEEPFIQIPSCNLKGLVRSHPSYSTLTTYEEVFELHCSLVREVVHRYFVCFAAERAAKKCTAFVQQVQDMGFVGGYETDDFEALKRARDSGVSCSPHKRRRPASLSEGIFSDVSYEIYDPYLEGSAVVLNNEVEKEDLAEDCCETEERPCSRSSDQPINVTEDIRFVFDPEKDAHLLAMNAKDTHKEDPEIMKYWYQRYRLFSRLNQGVLMDREGWFSVTPERIAEHIADRLVQKEGAVIMDAFAGVGGNSIQLAMRGAQVIAVDLDPVRLKCARENARVYGVEKRIEFILGDFFHVAAAWEKEGKNKIDAVFLSPPWGGPAYLKTKVFNLHKGLILDGFKIFNAAKNISENIAYFLPRHTSLKQLVSLAGAGGKCEIEQSYLNKKIKTITVYYGDLVAPT